MPRLIVTDTLGQKHVSKTIDNVEISRDWFRNEHILLPIDQDIVGIGDSMDTYKIDNITINMAHVVTMQWFYEQQ